MAKRANPRRNTDERAFRTAAIYEPLPGEHFNFSDVQMRQQASDEELNIRYIKGDIRIVTESARYSLAGILSMLAEDVPVEGGAVGALERRYKLDPEYQRRHRWSNQRKSRLIESFLMNIPVPPVFLYERDLARFEVMDGRQRLTALAEFYDNKFALEGLEYWPDLDGRRYNSLPSKVKDGIDRRYISSIILLKETASSEDQASFLKKIVFERLNSGGVKLSAQETRNAVYGGPLNKLCIELSKNERFRLMWGIPSQIEADYQPEENDEIDMDASASSSTRAGERMFERMEDVELILRFFAYRHIGHAKSGLNKITQFLDDFLRIANRFPKETLDQYRRQFDDTVDFLYDCLGSEAFSSRAGLRPTKIVYDPLMYVANSKEVVKFRSKIVQHKHVLKRALDGMYEQDRESQQSEFAGRRTNSSDIAQRNTAMLSVFRSVINQIEA